MLRLFSSVFFFIYRFIFIPMCLCVFILLLWPFNRKIKVAISLRRAAKNIKPIVAAPIWIHASSGEFEYAKSIVRAVKLKFPKQPLMVTYFSPSYAKQITSFPGVDLAVPLPLDLPGPVADFLSKYKPQMLLIARTDLWPELLSQVKRRKIPALLFSATFRPLSGWRYFLRPYYRMIFNCLSHVQAVASEDQQNILSSGTTTPITECSDTRYDQVTYRLAQTSKVRSELFIGQKSPILIAGSTWPEDENTLLSASRDLLINNKFKLVLAPHEPTLEHLQNLIIKLNECNLTHEIYTNAKNFYSQVLLIDKMGILADLYAHCNFAFVGGSFKNKVHSVMEPLSAGLPTIVGPYHKNNREALQFQKIKLGDSFFAVNVVTNAQQFNLLLQNLLDSTEQMSKAKLSLSQEINRRTQATVKVMDWIDAHIKLISEIKETSL